MSKAIALPLANEQKTSFLLNTAQMREKLEESLAVASNPNSPRYSHEEIFAPLRKKYGADI